MPPLRRSNHLKGLSPSRRCRPCPLRARPLRPRQARRVPRSAHRRDPTSARERHPVMTARPLRPPRRLRAPRPCPGPRLTERPTAPRSARSRPTAPPRTGRQVPARPIRRPVGCRRSRHRRRPGPGQKPVSPEPTRSPRAPRARPAPRGCRDRRGPRLPRPTSVARRRVKGAREAKAARPGPRLRVPARRVAQADSVPVPPRAVPIRAARVPGHPRRGPRDLVLPVRVRPGQVDPVRVRAPRAPAPGRATTRSVRPRPAWGRRLPLGPRGLARPVSPTVPAVPVLRQAARVVPAARVPPGAVRVGPACPKAVRVPVASRVRVPAAPGRAR